MSDEILTISAWKARNARSDFKASEGRTGVLHRPERMSLVDALVASLTGKSLSGRRLRPPGWAPGILGQAGTGLVESLPQFQLGQAVVGKQYRGTPNAPRVYDANLRDLLARYLGYPHARVSPYALQRQRQRQDNPNP